MERTHAVLALAKPVHPRKTGIIFRDSPRRVPGRQPRPDPRGERSRPAASSPPGGRARSLGPVLPNIDQFGNAAADHHASDIAR